MLPQVLRHLIFPLVDYPDQVQIDHVYTQHVDIFLLLVAEEDRGYVLGRDGQTADALRAIMRRCAESYERDIVIDILD